MRISILEHDPGYEPYARLVADGVNVKVTLDGVEQKACLTADSSEGWIRRFVLGDDGPLYAHGNSEFFTEFALGKVEIVIEGKAA